MGGNGGGKPRGSEGDACHLLTWSKLLWDESAKKSSKWHNVAEGCTGKNLDEVKSTGLEVEELSVSVKKLTSEWTKDEVDALHTRLFHNVVMWLDRSRNGLNLIFWA